MDESNLRGRILDLEARLYALEAAIGRTVRMLDALGERMAAACKTGAPVSNPTRAGLPKNALTVSGGKASPARAPARSFAKLGRRARSVS